MIFALLHLAVLQHYGCRLPQGTGGGWNKKKEEEEEEQNKDRKK